MRDARKDIADERKKQREQIEEQYQQIRDMKRAEMGLGPEEKEDEEEAKSAEPEQPMPEASDADKKTNAPSGWVWEKQ